MQTLRQKLQGRPDSPFDLWRLHLAGSQREIGRDLAELALQRQFFAKDAPALLEEDERSLDKLFKTHGGPLSDRARGIADCFARAGVTRSGYSLPVVDEPPAFACSAAVMTSANGPAMIRNFDFTLRSFPDLLGVPSPQSRPMIDPVCLLTLKPDEGYSTIAMVSMDLLLGAIDGINDAGFCAAMLSLSGEGAGPVSPQFDCFDELAIVRVLLERCASVSEAICVFRDLPKYTTFLPCHYIVADCSGDGAILEWDGETAHVARRQQSELLVCTNHPLAMPPIVGSRIDGPTDVAGIMSSVDRFHHLESSLRHTTPDREALLRAADQVRLNAFAAESQVFGGTLWTSLYRFDPSQIEVSVLRKATDGHSEYSDPLIETLAR